MDITDTNSSEKENSTQNNNEFDKKSKKIEEKKEIIKKEFDNQFPNFEPKPQQIIKKLKALRTRQSYFNYLVNISPPLPIYCSHKSEILIPIILQFLDILDIEKRSYVYIDVNKEIKSRKIHSIINLLFTNIEYQDPVKLRNLLKKLHKIGFQDDNFWNTMLEKIVQNQLNIFKNQSEGYLFEILDIIGDKLSYENVYIFWEEIVQNMILQVENQLENKSNHEEFESQNLNFKDEHYDEYSDVDIGEASAKFILFGRKLESNLSKINSEFRNKNDKILLQYDEMILEWFDNFTLEQLIIILKSFSWVEERERDKNIVQSIRNRIIDLGTCENFKQVSELLEVCYSLNLKDSEVTLHIIAELRKNLIIIEESEGQKENIELLIHIYKNLINMEIYELEIFNRIDQILQLNCIILDSEVLTEYIKSHSNLLHNLKHKYLLMLNPNHSEYSKRKSEVLSNIRKLNHQFWDDIIFSIGPRINEFTPNMINDILQSACKPRIGKRSVQRILVAFAAQSIELLSSVDNQRQFNIQFRDLLNNSAYLFHQKSHKNMILATIEDKIPKQKLKKVTGVSKSLEELRGGESRRHRAEQINNLQNEIE